MDIIMYVGCWCKVALLVILYDSHIKKHLVMMLTWWLKNSSVTAETKLDGHAICICYNYHWINYGKINVNFHLFN